MVLFLCCFKDFGKGPFTTLNPMNHDCRLAKAFTLNAKLGTLESQTLLYLFLRLLRSRLVVPLRTATTIGAKIPRP